MVKAWCAGIVMVLLVASAADAQAGRCAMTELPGLSRQFAAISNGTDVTAAGHSAEFAKVAGSILGEAVAIGVEWPTLSGLPCSPEVRARDRQAWRMAMVGYSAKEIADVLEGHLTVMDLDQARLRLMAGQPRALVADFLDARWREPIGNPSTSALRASADKEGLPPQERETAAMVAMRAPRLNLPDDLDAELAMLADRHGVPTALVRAMVAAESGGNARARSSAGAIGLMQLMPATAAALGVNPWRPRENLRGGITYIAGLLREYGEDPRLALIAYNAGPQHANRVRAGSAVAYRETRRYLDAIAAHYPLP